MKHLYKQGWAKSNIPKILFSTVLFFAIGFIFNGLQNQTAYASPGNNNLLLIGEYCHDLHNLDNAFSAGTNSNANTCRRWEDIVKRELGCSDLFYEHEFKDGDKKWYTKEGAYKDCYSSALAQLKLITDDCTNVKDGSDLWKNRCKANQNHLHEALGCSNKMFSEDGDHWTPIQTRVDACRGRIDEVGNFHLIIIGPDGNPVADTNPISSDAVQGEAASGDAADKGDIPCVGGAMGWVLCPIINYMADGIRAVAGFIDSMMQFKLLIGTQSGQGIRDAMNNFIGLANIILVIAFLFIIFSQSTSLGLSNYNIKKMLPKIIIAAILINLSFYICAFAIDISNIVGNSIMGLITGQSTTDATVSSGIGQATGLTGPDSTQKVFGAVFGAVIGVILLILFLGPLALGVFITFVILVARQVIILFLVITAPLAFAAWLLPNTETWYKKWQNLFINMLMVYPMIMLVFGAAIFAATFISNPAIQDPETSGLMGSKTIGPLVSLIVLAIPLLALPFILRSSNAMLGKVASAAQKYGGGQASNMLGKGARKGVRNAPGIKRGFEAKEQFKGAREKARNQGRARRAVRRAGWLSAAAGGGYTKTGRTLGSSAEAGRKALFDEEVKEKLEQVKAQYGGDTATMSTELAREMQNNGDAARAQALQRAIIQQGGGGVQDLYNAYQAGGTVSGDMERALREGAGENFQSTATHARDLARWDFAQGAGEFGNVTPAQLATQTIEAMDRYETQNGNISQQLAQRTLESEEAKNLNDATYQRLVQRAGPGYNPPPPPGGGPQNPPGGGQGPQQGRWSSRGSSTGGGTTGGITWTLH